MATNGTQSPSGNQDDTVTLNLTWTALFISIGAFVLSTLQALLAYLQFDNSEEGRRRCSEEVMGEMWASRTRKEFKWREWRYQVFYEAPIFFTAPSGITVGPLTRRKPKVKLRDLFWRDYDNEKSLVNSRAIQQRAIAMEVIEIQKHVLTIYKITGTENSCKHTMTPMNNEGKIGLDYMQDEGCSWLLLLEALQEQERESRIWDNTPSHGLDHPICYFIQRFRRCWDHMPPNIREPYATTNICHLVEIMSMLGLVWKEFDVNKPSLNAEGNGYMVKGEYISGLGGSSILMRFTRLSKPGHGENRIIPCYELKRLCFGEVPSLFDTVKENLQVSPGRLEHCLKRLLPKLSYEHRQLFLLNTTNKPLMFPITFELIAMLAKSAHIPGSKFRRLPNPCADTWNPVLDVAACLRAFAGSINDNSNFGSHRLVTELQNLFRYGRIDTLVLTYGQSLEQKIKAYSDAASHLADENADRYYYPEYERQTVKDQAAQIYNTRLLDLLDSLHWALERVDERLRDMVDTPEFSEVVTLHLAAVLDQQPILNAELAHATRDNPKEKILISFYFNNIYPAVVKGSAEEVSNKQISDSTTSHPATGSRGSRPFSKVIEERGAIWLVLMFRMWSWLFLHDFNPEDKMIERSEFMNNRLPIYIR